MAMAMVSIPSTLQLPFTSKPQNLSAFLSKLRSQFLGLRSRIACSRIGPSNGSRAHCWFKFGKNGVDTEGAAIYDVQQGNYRGPKPKRNWVADWVLKNDGAARSLPICVGGFSLLAVLVNRTLSGIAPVADASSSQSRADLLTLGLAVTNILVGLVWLSIRPKSISPVDPEGVDCLRMQSNLPNFVVSELLWVWETLSLVTCCRSVVIVYGGSCILQVGVASPNVVGEPVAVDAIKLFQGSLCRDVVKSTAQSYLANLSLYPGKSELPFLPENTQAVILQPLGNNGIAIIGGDTIRGFTNSDRAWITLIGDKLDATLTQLDKNITLAAQNTL